MARYFGPGLFAHRPTLAGYYAFHGRFEGGRGRRERSLRFEVMRHYGHEGQSRRFHGGIARFRYGIYSFGHPTLVRIRDHESGTPGSFPPLADGGWMDGKMDGQVKLYHTN